MQDVAPTLPAKPSAICIAPTRELAMQVAKHLRAVAAGSLLERRGTIVTLVGGMAEVKQRRLLSFAPKVVVATPGRLYDLIEAEAISLANVRVFGVHPRTSSRFFFLRHEASAVVDGALAAPRARPRLLSHSLDLMGFALALTRRLVFSFLSLLPPPGSFRRARRSRSSLGAEFVSVATKNLRENHVRRSRASALYLLRDAHFGPARVALEVDG